MKISYVYPSRLDHYGNPIKYRKAYLPPLSIAILDSLTPRHHKVRIFNDNIEDIDFSDDYDLVGITAITSQAPRAYQIASKFRSNGAKVILGGLHPSLMPDEALKHADSVVIGEAEMIWEQVLLDAENGHLRPTYKMESFQDLSRLVIPKWDNIDLSIYRRSIGKKRMPRMPIFTTRGCIYKCKYCSVSKFFGSTYRFKPIKNVLKEIDATAADSYFFVDDNLICAPDYSEELFRALKKRNIRWFSQASVQFLKYPHLIELAARAGCRDIFLGIESIDKDNLKFVKKGFNKPEKYVELIRRLETVGIKPWVSIILGLDNDDVGQLHRTVEFLEKADVWNAVFFILTPLPGTELYDEFLANGRILENDWSKYDCQHVVYKPINFSPDQLHKEFWKIYKSYYSPLSIAKRVLRSLKSPIYQINSIHRKLAIQFYTYKQLRIQEHPFSMGIDRLN